MMGQEEETKKSQGVDAFDHTVAKCSWCDVFFKRKKVTLSVLQNFGSYMY